MYGCQGNGLLLKGVRESDTGIYSCYLDNFVQPIVSYKFSLMVEGPALLCQFIGYAVARGIKMQQCFILQKNIYV